MSCTFVNVFLTFWSAVSSPSTTTFMLSLVNVLALKYLSVISNTTVTFLVS